MPAGKTEKHYFDYFNGGLLYGASFAPSLFSLRVAAADTTQQQFSCELNSNHRACLYIFWNKNVYNYAVFINILYNIYGNEK